jgi:hypothetical protein
MIFGSRSTLAAVFGGGVALSAVLGAATTACSNSNGPALLKSSLGVGDAGGDGATSDDSPAGSHPDDGSSPSPESGVSPGSEGGSGSGSGGSGPGSEGGSSPGSDDAGDLGDDDAADGAGAGGACNALTADGPLVGQTVLSGSQPDAMGGHVYSGTYWLTERDTFGGTPDGLFVQRSLVIDDTTINTVGGESMSDAGMPAWTTAAATYEVLDLIVLSETQSCPGPSHRVNVQFTAVGGQLTLYPTMDTAEVYTLQ